MKNAPINRSPASPASPASSTPNEVLRAGRGQRAYAAGHVSEQMVADRLEQEGWTILARRLRNAGGEIDLIARLGSLLCFVEVKARRSLAEAAFSLTQRQRQRLLAAASIALAERPEWLTGDCRFDVIIVDPAGQMRRIADAFRADR